MYSIKESSELLFNIVFLLENTWGSICKTHPTHFPFGSPFKIKIFSCINTISISDLNSIVFKLCIGPIITFFNSDFLLKKYSTHFLCHPLQPKTNNFLPPKVERRADVKEQLFYQRFWSTLWSFSWHCPFLLFPGCNFHRVWTYL